MIKQLILLIMILALSLLASENNQIIQVIIVVPPELVPYFEWLFSFPGWQPQENIEPTQQPILVTGL